MQKDSKLFEDFAKMASGAAGSLMDMRRELETILSERLERLFAGERFVTRDEFEVVKAMAEKARAENALLRAELDALKK